MNQMMGSSIPFMINGKLLFLGYISVLEWDIYSDMLEHVYDADAVMYLFNCSFMRGGNPQKKRSLKKIIKNTLIATEIIKKICELSLPDIHGKQKSNVPEDFKNTQKNIKIMYRVLAKMYGWTALVLNQMSPAQLHAYMTAGSDGTGIRKMSSSEYQTFLRSKNNG